MWALAAQFADLDTTESPRARPWIRVHDRHCTVSWNGYLQNKVRDVRIHISPQLNQWLENNIEGVYRVEADFVEAEDGCYVYTGTYVRFADNEDAVLFNLAWAGVL